MSASRIATALLLAVAASAGAQIQNDLPALQPKTPTIMGQGGSLVTDSSGFDSFFSNPAGFADSNGQFTLLTAAPWLYLVPTVDNLTETVSAAQSIASGDTGAAIKFANDKITGNGFGAGALAGIGWTGKNLGLAFYAIADGCLSGSNLLGATGSVGADAAMVIGVGYPLQLGPVTLKIGGDLRPMVRVRGDLDSASVFSFLAALQTGQDMVSALSGVPVDSGFSLSCDLGAELTVGRFSFALAARDLSFPLSFVTTDLGTFIDTISRGDLPGSSAGASAQVWTLPVITAGASIDLGNRDLDPIINSVVSLEIEDPLRVIADRQSPWNLLHVGARATFFRHITARAGLNKGYASFGAGLNLWIMDVNAAIFTEELGIRPGDRPRAGCSVEVALRGDFPAKRKSAQ